MTIDEEYYLRLAFDEMMEKAPGYSMDNSEDRLWILFKEVVQRYIKEESKRNIW